MSSFRYMIAVLVLTATPLAVMADTSVCYTTVANACVAPTSVNVSAGGEFVLPAKIAFTSDESRTTAFVILPDGLVWSAASVTGDTGNLSVSNNVLTTVGDGGSWGLENLRFKGNVRVGEVVTVEVIVNNPNTAKRVLETSIDVAVIAGVDNRLITTLNPASNTAQATFLRIVNPNASEALVSLSPTDDTGAAGGDVIVTVPARGGVQLTSADLEGGNDNKPLSGAFGVGSGKWWVRMNADQRVLVQVFVRNPGTGALAEVGGVIVTE